MDLCHCVYANKTYTIGNFMINEFYDLEIKEIENDSFDILH